MNDIELRELIRGRMAASSVADTMEMDAFQKCPKCGAGREWLLPGGVGDWRRTVTCEQCFTVQKNVPLELVILPLQAQQRGEDLDAARAREAAEHAAYVAAVVSASQAGSR